MQSHEEPRATKTLIVPEQITNQGVKLIRWAAVGPTRELKALISEIHDSEHNLDVAN